MSMSDERITFLGLGVPNWLQIIDLVGEDCQRGYRMFCCIRGVSSGGSKCEHRRTFGPSLVSIQNFKQYAQT